MSLAVCVTLFVVVSGNSSILKDCIFNELICINFFDPCPTVKSRGAITRMPWRILDLMGQSKRCQLHLLHKG